MEEAAARLARDELKRRITLENLEAYEVTLPFKIINMVLG